MGDTRHSRGICVYCGKEFTRGGMSRHLHGCDERTAVVESAQGRHGRRVPLLHLQARDAWTGRYWMNLEVDGTATLAQLDAWLRVTWLECCGHLSRFSVGGWGGREIPMAERVGKVIRPGTEITHIYDFGAETVTVVRGIDVREGSRTTPRPIALMARNTPLALPCQRCEAPATRVCPECVHRGLRGTLCAVHARHRHDGYDETVELVNSPRAGICGYAGPAEPPY